MFLVPENPSKPYQGTAGPESWSLRIENSHRQSNKSNLAGEGLPVSLHDDFACSWHSRPARLTNLHLA